MTAIRHEHQLNAQELAFLNQVADDPRSATDARPAIRAAFAACFDMSAIPEARRGFAAFAKARRFRRLFERRGVETSWAGGEKKAPRRAVLAVAKSGSPDTAVASAETKAREAAPEPSAPLPQGVRRYEGDAFDGAALDAAAEDIRIRAMEDGTLSVALSALKLRAAHHGLIAPPVAERKKEEDPFEGMSNAEIERKLQRLMGEYHELTGRDLARLRTADADGEGAA